MPKVRDNTCHTHDITVGQPKSRKPWKKRSTKASKGCPQKFKTMAERMEAKKREQELRNKVKEITEAKQAERKKRALKLREKRKQKVLNQFRSGTYE